MNRVLSAFLYLLLDFVSVNGHSAVLEGCTLVFVVELNGLIQSSVDLLTYITQVALVLTCQEGDLKDLDGHLHVADMCLHCP